jgi:hypothetical protein
MDTIIRHHGKIVVYSTVLRTIKYKLKFPGMFSIGEIQKLINDQIEDPKEYVTRDEIRRSIALMIGSVRK